MSKEVEEAAGRTTDEELRVMLQWAEDRERKCSVVHILTERAPHYGHLVRMLRELQSSRSLARREREMREGIQDVISDLAYAGHANAQVGCDTCDAVTKLNAILARAALASKDQP